MSPYKTSPILSTCLLAITLSLVHGVITATATASYFTEPEAPFIMGSSETIQVVPLPAGSVESAQTIIDAARSNNPASVLLLQPAGKLEVGTTPLQLGGNMCLELSPEACIAATADCSAPSLISITNAMNVSISSSGPGVARIDGGEKPLTGISVIGGGRVNFDLLSVTGCQKAAIDYRGNDAGAYNEAASVTRCRIEHNGDGLKVDQTAAFVCIDNVFRNNSGTALEITSLSSIVAGNDFSGNKTAILSGSDRGVVTRNMLGTNQLAIELTVTSSNNLLSENRGSSTNQAVTVAGMGNQFFRNRITGTLSMPSRGSNNLLIANEGLSPDGSAADIGMFNPPTFANPHSNPVIITGMGRTDITLQGGVKSKKPLVEKRDANGKIIPMAEGIDTKEKPVDIVVVQETLNKASAENPTNVVVAHLEGDFISKTTNGLMLPNNSCVILNGRILTDLGIPIDPPWVKGAPETQVVLMAKKGFSSFSGGKVDAGRQARFGINAGKEAPSIALIEGVNVSSSAHDGIYIKGRSSQGPLYLYRNNVFGSGGRGIWPHVSTPVYSIANTCSGNRMDGIDFDAHGHNNIALFNICTGNGRHGLFLEEAVHNNLAFGNIFSGNRGSGVHIWNQEVTGNTGSNSIVGNICVGNRKGVSVGGRADDRTASGNLVFNNVCEDNIMNGIASGQSHSTNNFFSQCVVRLNNGEQIQDSESAKAFFLNGVTPSSSQR
jgi:hypothetical protein